MLSETRAFFGREVFPTWAAHLKILLINSGTCVFASADFRNLLPQLSGFIITLLSAISADLHTATPTALALKPWDIVNQNLFALVHVLDELYAGFLTLSYFVWDVHKCLGILYKRAGEKTLPVCVMPAGAKSGISVESWLAKLWLNKTGEASSSASWTCVYRLPFYHPG